VKLQKFLIAALLTTTSTANAFMVSVDVKKSKIDLKLGGLMSGHEEITRQALVKAREQVIKNLEFDPVQGNEELFGDLDSHFFGTKGSDSPNVIIRGNYAADYPKSPEKNEYPLNLFDFWGFQGINTQSEWHANPNGQTIHGLRNYSGTNLVDTGKTCGEIRARIKKATIEGVKFWEQGMGKTDTASLLARKKGAFLIGQATHIMQDSFSPAHTQRFDHSKQFSLADLCYYGKDQKKLMDPDSPDCYHHTVDVRDYVYIMSPKQAEMTQAVWAPEPVTKIDDSIVEEMKKAAETEGEKSLFKSLLVKIKLLPAKIALIPFTSSQKEASLKHEARLARQATAEYLYLVAQYLYEKKKNPMGAGAFDADYAKLAERLDYNLFDGRVEGSSFLDKMPYGILRCDHLVTNTTTERE
jgi:hypothetical protein